MNNLTASNYEKLLSELNAFEKDLQDESLQDFKGWKLKVQNLLEGSYRIRFSRLEFYEKEVNNSDNDIPF